MIDSGHIIEKVFLDVNTHKMGTAQFFKNSISEFLEMELFSRLELIFDEYNLDDTIIRFDELNINLSVNNSGNFESIKYEIAKQFEKIIKLKIEPVLLAQRNAQEKLINSVKGNLADKTAPHKISRLRNNKLIFLYFLKRGYLPWYGNEEQINEISTFESWLQSIEDSSFVEELRNVFWNENAAVDRFINQIQVENIVAFLVKINPKAKNYQQRILHWVNKNDPEINPLFLKLLMQISLDYKIELIVAQTRILFQGMAKKIEWKDEVSAIKKSSQFVILLRDVLPEGIKRNNLFIRNFRILAVEKPTKKEIKAAFLSGNKDIQEDIIVKENYSDEDNTEPLFSEKETNEIAVQNAGIIIVHPFLKHLLINTEIADKKGKLIKGKLDLAVQAVHFVATGNENVFEGNLVFEKFLCGVPLKMSIKKRSLLTDEIRKEVEVMLKEVIKNWPALKNSSINDLRQMFFQRDGKLVQKENKYKLIVERKAQDILLEKLSWNISMVKLGWLDKLIYVEW